MERDSGQWGHLMADLQELVDAGILIEIREPGEPSRYAPSWFEEPATSDVASSAHVHPLPDWPEPCPARRATEGFDGGGRCLACRVHWPPEM